MTVKRRILIKGRKVHNVGYRPFLMERAQELKIPNFHAKNIKENGKQVVDVRVGGEGGRIDNFLKFVNENWPEFAEVENISVEEKEYEEDIMTLEDFSSLLSALQLSKIVQAGLGMVEMQKLTIEMQKQALGKHDQTLDKQDSMLDKQDSMLDKQDSMLDKQDSMLDKQDQTLTVIKSGVDEMRESREENKTLLLDFHHDTIQRFDNLDAKYGKIAENMERILEELKEERKEYRESIERLVNAIIESRKEK